jgi:hypothetical protein
MQKSEAPSVKIISERITLPDDRYLIYYTFEVPRLNETPSSAKVEEPEPSEQNV